MRERPILFSGPMVKALLAGTKTQTRRVVKPQPPADTDYLIVNEDPGGEGSLCISKWEGGEFGPGVDPWRRCPYGQPGDRLWVRESFHINSARCWAAPKTLNPSDPERAAYYAADWERSAPPWKPSIHMPRWASRLLLEVVEVRAERLQSITEEDAQSEGIQPATHLGPCRVMVHARKGFRHLWDEINGKRAPWESNPWVWALTFKRVGE
jgi:hypothetical protein